MAAMKRSPLSRVESLIRKVVEEPFTWLAGDPLDPFRLATHLVRHYEDAPNDGTWPNQFTIYLNPDDYAEMAAAGLPELEAQVADYLALLAERRGLHPTEPARVIFEADPAELPRRAHAVAGHQAEQPDSHTAVFADDAGPAAGSRMTSTAAGSSVSRVPSGARANCPSPAGVAAQSRPLLMTRSAQASTATRPSCHGSARHVLSRPRCWKTNRPLGWATSRSRSTA